MGYSTGKELFEGNCRNKLTFLECATCCTMFGLPQSEVDICVDLCLAHHGEGKAQAELLEAATVVDSHDTRDYVKFNRAKHMLKVSRKSKQFPRIAKIATKLCRDLGLDAVES